MSRANLLVDREHSCWPELGLAIDGKVIAWEAATGKRLREWVIHE